MLLNKHLNQTQFYEIYFCIVKLIFLLIYFCVFQAIFSFLIVSIWYLFTLYVSTDSLERITHLFSTIWVWFGIVSIWFSLKSVTYFVDNVYGFFMSFFLPVTEVFSYFSDIKK